MILFYTTVSPGLENHAVPMQKAYREKIRSRVAGSVQTGGSATSSRVRNFYPRVVLGRFERHIN
jgi:hypothetical protein